MKSLFYLNKYIYKYRVRLLLGILFVVITNCFAIFPAQVIRYSLDFIKENITVYHLFQGFDVQSSFQQNIILYSFLFFVLIVLLAVLKSIFLFLMRQTIIIMSRLMEYDLKNEIFEHYQKLPVAFYKRNNTGDLMTRISEDVGRVRMYLGPAIMYTLNLIVLFVLVLTTMLNVNTKLTFYVLLPLPILTALIYYVSAIIEKKSERVQRQLSNLSTIVQEAFSGIRIIKTYLREHSSQKNFIRESEDYKNKSLDLTKVNAFFSPTILLLVGLSTLLTIYVGGKEAMAGRITFGNIAEFIYYVNMLTWPFASVGWVTSLVQRAAASQQRINEFLNTPSEEMSLFLGRHQEVKGNIQFNRVSFVYPDTGIKALHEISFRIEQGKSLAVLGRTGSGKSTIASLLTRMYDLTSGEILLDGNNITSFSLGTLREQIGYVPQDVFLFSDTIGNNISFGVKKNKADAALIKQAAQDAVVYDEILKFPKDFETLIGERGITLSGGQKQRISIARAIIKSPKILIFDDCLSAVDTRTEEEILNNLKKIMQGKTSVIISHRVSTVKNADYIIFLDNGKIIEEGTHLHLMGNKGNYYTLYEKQQIENEIY